MAPVSETIAVRGLRPLIRDFQKLSKDGLSRPLTAELKALAEPVAAEARQRAARFGPKVSRGIRAGTRAGVTAVVRQGNRKTTGKRPDFGALQMRTVLIPALQDNQDEIFAAAEELLDRLVAPGGLETGGLL